MLALAVLLLATPPTFTGSGGTRLTGTLPNEGALLSTRDLPMGAALFDLNLQGKGRLLDDTLTLSFDVSGFAPLQAGYADRDLDTDQLGSIEDHEVLGVRPAVVFSEGFVAWEPLPHLVLTLGKKRVVWGPGMVWSPTDVLNPLRDPTDPSGQRTGILMAKVDAPFERFTLTALVSPAILEESAGLPRSLLYWPESDLFNDGLLHWAAALRAYALLFDADINAWLVVSNLYRGTTDTDFENHPRLMFTLSRTIFTSHEVHAEVLVEQGSTRVYTNGACVEDEQSFARCLLTGEPLLERKRLDSPRILPTLLVGWRPMADDGSMLSFEYMYQADGMMPDEFADWRAFLEGVGEAQRLGLLPATLPIGAQSTQSGLPNRASFNPQRRHYVLATAQKPQLFDDFTLGATLIIAAEDLSGIASGSVLWSATEWLQLTLTGFVPVPSVVAPGDGEFDRSPFVGRVVFDVRAFF